jgi:hypothetical protein
VADTSPMGRAVFEAFQRLHGTRLPPQASEDLARVLLGHSVGSVKVRVTSARGLPTSFDVDLASFRAELLKP